MHAFNGLEIISSFTLGQIHISLVKLDYLTGNRPLSKRISGMLHNYFLSLYNTYVSCQWNSVARLCWDCANVIAIEYYFMRSLKLLKITSLATEFHINLYHFHSTTLMLISRVETGVDLIGFPSFSSLAYNTFSLPDFVVTLRYHYGCRTPCRLFCLLTNTSLGPFVLICVGKRSGDRTRPINDISTWL